jgi:hypothetical protein
VSPFVARLTVTRAVLLGLLAWLGAALSTARAAAPVPPADQWLTNFVQFPPHIATNFLRLAEFDTLHAEAIAGKLKVSWQNPALGTNALVTAFSSADEPGHWPVRDWRTVPMTLRGNQWEAAVPIENIDVPLVYFVQVVTDTATNVSRMRICRPRAAGLEEPSLIFWPFLEGFELGTDRWRLLTTTPSLPPLGTDPLAKNGHAALVVPLPVGQHSVTVGTTRVRGWQVEQEFATGLRLWLRAKQGGGKVRFTLLAHAYGTNQVIGVFPQVTVVRDQWQRVDLPFNALPKFPLGNLDFFTIEFLGDGPREFLVDDLSLLGRWKLPVE